MKRRERRWLIRGLTGLAVLAALTVDLSRGPDPLEPIRGLWIEDGGRVYSFQAFATARWLSIAGPRMAGDPVARVLAIAAEPLAWQTRPVLWLSSPVLADALGLPAGMTHLSMSALQSQERFGRLLAAALERRRRGETLSQTDRQVLELYGRLAALHEVMQQELRLISPYSPASPQWLPVLEPDGYPADQQIGAKRAWGSLLRAVREGQPQQLEAAGRRFSTIVAGLKVSGLSPPIAVHPSAAGVAFLAAIGILIAAGFHGLRRFFRRIGAPLQLRTAGEPLRERALVNRVQAVCWDHARNPLGYLAPEGSCQITRMLPTLSELSGRAGADTFDGFAGSVEQMICRSCEHMDQATGICSRREHGECCLFRYLPLVYDALEQARPAGIVVGAHE